MSSSKMNDMKNSHTMQLMIPKLQKQYCLAEVALTFLLMTGGVGSMKYDCITHEIFASWIPVHNILLKMKDKALRTLFVNPPVLPWYAAKNLKGYCSFIMNFVTTRSTNTYKNGGNCANYIRSNGQMTESCWQLPRQSLGDEIFFNSLRCDFWPFAYKHKNQHGKPEDIFHPDDLAEIMVHVSKFIETVICLSTKLSSCLLLHMIMSRIMSVRKRSMPSSRVVNYSHFQRKSANQVVTQR